MQRIKYGFYVIMAAILFGISPTVVSLTYQYGGNTATTTFLVSVFTVAVYVLIIRFKGLSLFLNRKLLTEALVLGGATSFTNLLLWTSYNYLSSGTSTVLHFMYPAVITFILVAVFHEHLCWQKGLALLASVAGVVFISWDSFSTSAAGILCALLSGVFWAVYIILLDKFSIGKENVFVTGFYVYLCQAVISFVYALSTHTLNRPAGLFWLLILAEISIGIISCALLQVGTNRIGSFSAGIFATFEPLTAFILSYVVFKDDLKLFQLVGTGLIISGVLMDVVGTHESRTDVDRKSVV